MKENGREFWNGARAAVPVIMGYIPVGIAYGMMGRQAGLSVWQTCALSLFVYTGAGEMAAANMIALQVSYLTIVITTLLLNLRHIIMSVVVMDRLRRLPLVARLLLAFGVTDEVFAVFSTEDARKPSGWYFAGLALFSWLSWNAGTFLGAYSSSFFPPVLSAALSISLYAMFIALLVPSARSSRKIALVILETALLSLVFSRFLSSSWTILAATLLGAFLGLLFVDEEDLS